MAKGRDDDVTQVVDSLFRDLNLASSRESDSAVSLRRDFGGVLLLSPDLLRRVGFDIAVVAGVSGDWSFSLDVCSAIITRGNDDRMTLKLWQLRCLVEMERWPEALALSSHARWEPEFMVHVNYLTGLVFEALGLIEKARTRFEAVRKVNPRYREVSTKVD